jgi:hypothetical protein
VLNLNVSMCAFQARKCFKAWKAKVALEQDIATCKARLEDVKERLTRTKAAADSAAAEADAAAAAEAAEGKGEEAGEDAAEAADE